MHGNGRINAYEEEKETIANMPFTNHRTLIASTTPIVAPTSRNCPLTTPPVGAVTVIESQLPND